MIMIYVVIGLLVAFAIFVCFALAVASFSFDNYYENLKKTNQMQNSCGVSTLDYVDEINDKYFDSKLNIMRCPEHQDHYSSGVVALSEKTMASNSLASLAIVSHELGHARQDSQGNKLVTHWKRKRTGRIVGLFFMPLVITGAILSILNIVKVLPELLYLILGLCFLGGAFVIFAFSIFLKIREIKIEKEASDFAVEYLKEVLTTDEIKICRDFLNSARLTYWASLFKGLLGWTFLTKNDSMFK